MDNKTNQLKKTSFFQVYNTSKEKGILSSLSSTALRSNIDFSFFQIEEGRTSFPSSSVKRSDTRATEKCLLIPAGL